MNLNEKLDYANSRMASMGLSIDQRAGVLGSLMGESGRGLNTGAFNPKDPNGGSRGIAQWHGDRWSGMTNFAAQTGRKTDDFKAQFDWAMKEAQTTHKKALDAVKAATSPAAAAKAWTNLFDRPNPAYAHHDKRAAHANFAKGYLTGKPVTDVGPLDVSLTGAKIDPTKTASVDAKGFPSAPGKPGTASAATAVDANGFPAAPGATSAASSGFKDLGTGLESIVDGLLGTKSTSSTKEASAGAKGGLSGLVSNFMGEANTGAKLGAIAGGLFGGGPGAVMGGLLGQGIGMMLGGLANAFETQGSLAYSAQEQRAIAQAQANSSSGYGNVNYGGLSDYGRDAYSSSGQVRDAVDSGQAGLY